MTVSAEAPSRRVDEAAWSRATDELVETVRELIRIPSTNPPPPDVPDGELVAARRIASMLEAAGLAPEVVEPVPGRGSVHVRLRGDGTGGAPLLLLSHLDVVPAPADRWSHDPFAADLADGYIYGRGAVDMKAMIGMELQVVRLLAAEARAAGLDPARDPIPGLRRDVLFTCTADEEAGGLAGREVGRRQPARLAARRRRPQRVRWGLDHDRRPAAVPDPGRREGLRRVPDRGPRDVGPRLDAARRQRGRPRGRRHRAARRPRPVTRDAGDGQVPRAGRGGPAGRRRPPPRGSVGRRPGPRRGRDRGRLRPDVRAGAARTRPRHHQPGRHPGRDQVQRHPGRRDDRGRLPRAAGDDRGGHACAGRRAARARAWRPPATSS